VASPLVSDRARAIVNQWAAVDRPAVIFDFNGTLSDDEPVLLRIFQELFDAHLNWSMSVEDYRRHLLGHSDREIIEMAVASSGAAVEVDRLLELRKHRYRELVADDNPIRPATVDLVRELACHDVPLAIVTGAQRDDVRAVLDSSPVGELVDVVVAEEDVRRGKPHPEGFLAGAARLGCSPRSTLVFEDSVPGVRAALAAGMHCIAVSAEPGEELLAVAPALVTRLDAEIVRPVLGLR
jgi:beta-phosphoglucomutase